MKRANRLLLDLLVVTFLVLICIVPGTFAKETIKIGSIVDLTGPSVEIGVPYAEGIADYIDKINKGGGINGRLIEYFPIDYAYKLPQAMAAYKRLAAEHKVSILIGWGTGDSKARIPLINKDEIVQLTTFALDNTEPYTPYNFASMISYEHQVMGMLKYAKDHPIEKGRKVRVAYVYSDAEYGRAPIKFLKERKAAENLGLEVVDEEIISHQVTEAVSQALTLKKAKPDYTILIVIPNPASVFVKDAKKVGLETTFMGFSFLGDYNFLKLVGDAGKGIIVAAPCSYSHEMKVPGIKKMWDYNKKYHPERKKIDLQYVYTWIYGMIIEEAVKRAGDNITGKGIKDALETFRNFETDAISKPITFTSTDHRGSYEFKLSRAIPEKGTFESFSDWIKVEK